MSKILIVLATTMLPQPAGQSFSGSYLFKVNDGTNSSAVIETTPSHTTEELSDGAYVATCQAIDTNNATMGDEVSLAFSLADGQIVVPGTPTPAPPPADNTYPAPLSLSATVLTL